MADQGDSAAEGIRRAIELVEQAPAEDLYAQLLLMLTRAGGDAELRGAQAVSKDLAFIYKLAVELGGKLGLLSEQDLAWRRRNAAMLFGAEEPPTLDEAIGRPHPGRIWTPKKMS